MYLEKHPTRFYQFMRLIYERYNVSVGRKLICILTQSFTYGIGCVIVVGKRMALFDFWIAQGTPNFARL